MKRKYILEQNGGVFDLTILSLNHYEISNILKRLSTDTMPSPEFNGNKSEYKSGVCDKIESILLQNPKATLRSIGRELNMHKNTVRTYLQKMGKEVFSESMMIVLEMIKESKSKEDIARYFGIKKQSLDYYINQLKVSKFIDKNNKITKSGIQYLEENK